MPAAPLSAVLLPLGCIALPSLCHSWTHSRPDLHCFPGQLGWILSQGKESNQQQRDKSCRGNLLQLFVSHEELWKGWATNVRVCRYPQRGICLRLPSGRALPRA